MEFKGTKGEWEIYTDEFDNHNITNNGHYLGEARSVYDAKLIAAAPEMLEMLLKTLDNISDEYCNLKEEIEQLIKKAIL